MFGDWHCGMMGGVLDWQTNVFTPGGELNMRITKILISLILGASFVSAAPLNGLYFGLDNMRGFAEVYWWFLADGRILRDTLPAGLNTQQFDSACQQNSGFCGSYTLSGDKLAIRYKNGTVENWTYKPLNGGIQLNYLILTPVEKFANGARLNGTWDRAFSAKVHSGPGSNATITSPTFYTFKPDGTFTFLNITGVDRESRVKGASTASSQQSQATGTYAVRDNVLTLVKNGNNEQHLIFPVAGGNLNIDGAVYKKR
jgi:hypothetical protein